MFAHRYRYGFITVLAVFTFLNTELCELYRHFQIGIPWYQALLTIWGVTWLTWEGNRLAEPLLKRRLLTAGTPTRYLLAFYLLGNLVAAGAALTMVWLVGSVLGGHSWAENRIPLKLNLLYAFLVNLLFHLLNTLVWFFLAYRRHWAEAEELRRRNATAQLQLIKSQMNPHFLFNNLNVLSGMVIRDNPEANRFIEAFCRVYRYILSSQEKELVELDAELGFIQPYLFLLGKRFDEGLRVDIRIPEACRVCQVVPAALQQLIENAIKHNVVSRHRPLHIDIFATDDQMLHVRNNLQPRLQTEPSTRIGLQNITKRYELLGGRTVNVHRTESAFEVVLPLLAPSA
ncbi:MAG TPA: histidine kinase [Chitinophagaceae bacterium]|nr:histidine kinase [Chitinophagaceae bacterium]